LPIAELDERSEKVNAKIREAQLAKIPYMLVIGDREAETQSVGVRHRKHADLGAKPVDEFVTMIAKQVADRALDE
jgi:threonyl-tRNA synthetase